MGSRILAALVVVFVVGTGPSRAVAAQAAPAPTAAATAAPRIGPVPPTFREDTPLKDHPGVQALGERHGFAFYLRHPQVQTGE